MRSHATGRGQEGEKGKKELSSRKPVWTNQQAEREFSPPLAQQRHAAEATRLQPSCMAATPAMGRDVASDRQPTP